MEHGNLAIALDITTWIILGYLAIMAIYLPLGFILSNGWLHTIAGLVHGVYFFGLLGTQYI